MNFSAFANVELIKFPKTRQLYPRDITTNKAVIPIQGLLYSTGDYDQLAVRVYRESALVSEQTNAVNFGSSSFMIFNYSVSIDAELANYTIELVGQKNGVSTVEALAEQVVAGDAYLINGQSNAQAFLSPNDDDLREFSRSYNTQSQWNYLNFSFPGLWGARLASQIVDEQQVPVAIFNGAIGAQPIATYLRNDQNLYEGNYGLLYQKLEDAGLVGNVRAAFWFHGEADGWTTSMDEYIDWFEELNSQWQNDFSIENAYIYQIRSQSCSHPNGDIFEAHRQLAQNIETVEIMSTGNALHDSCHFEYEFGYRELGDRMFDLMSMNQYDVTLDEQFHAPDLEKAYRSGEAELTIQFTNTDSLEVIGWPWLDFSTGQNEVQIVNGIVQGNKIVLQLSNDIDSLGTVTFRTHPGQANNFIVNPRGVAILSFYEAPLCTDCADVIDTPPNDNPGVSTNELSQFVEKIFPNPANNNLIIETSFEESIDATIQIFNNLGKPVYQKSTHIQANRQNIPIQLTNLPKGNYYLSIRTNQGTLTQRFIKL